MKNIRYFSIYETTYERIFYVLCTYIHDIRNFCLDYISSLHDYCPLLAASSISFIRDFSSSRFLFALPSFAFRCSRSSARRSFYTMIPNFVKFYLMEFSKNY